VLKHNVIAFKIIDTDCYKITELKTLGNLLYKVKVKAIPLQAWTGPEGSRRLRPPDFKTTGTLRW